jgi:BirA family biotin operon repressor/biotin-[acetyl-CoA-carboxylase] ligase
VRSERERPGPLPSELAAALDAARTAGRFKRLGTPVLHFPTVGSTNDVALDLAAGLTGPLEGTVVIADAQTAGRGRRGRVWFSPPGSGLYVSVVLMPSSASTAPERATTLLTLAAGVAIGEAIEAATGLRLDLKWPNDLGAGRLKVAGILADGLRATATAPGVSVVVLGYGINVGPMTHPPELAQRATSLAAVLDRPVDRGVLCAETLAALDRRYDDLLAGRFDAILDSWRARAPLSQGAAVVWESPSGPLTGVTGGIDEWGALLVRTGGRVERIVAGEVTWI